MKNGRLCVRNVPEDTTFVLSIGYSKNGITKKASKVVTIENIYQPPEKRILTITPPKNG